jgi:methyl-galactoside transport system substrate-binding protein
MKKIWIIIIALLLSACEPVITSIPVFIYDMNDAYMTEFEAKIRANALGHFNVTRIDGQNSQIIQNEQIDNYLNKDYPVLIINPVDRLSVYAMIEKAKQIDAHLIFFNREPLAEDMALYDKLFYIGADAAESAELQASLVMDLFGNDPETLNQFDKNGDKIIQTVILKGEQGHQDAEARTKVVIESLKEAGYTLEVLDIIIANWDRNTAYGLTQSFMELHQDDLELIISNNDAMALGAIDKLKEMNIFLDVNQDGSIDRDSEPWLPIVGIDGIAASLESIKQGYLYGTIVNDSDNMAKSIIELTDWILQDKDLADFPYPITDDKYVWIHYQKLSLEE